MLILFFFQAEDGIRDIGVTGVQTCALPIWMGEHRAELRCVQRVQDRRDDAALSLGSAYRSAPYPHKAQRAASARSEERRVGKECRYTGMALHSNMKM